MAYDIELVHHFTIEHAAAFQHAQALIPHLLVEYQGQLTGEPTISWQGARCAFGFPIQVGTVSGILDVHPNHLAIYIELPFLAKLAKQSIETAILTQLRTNFR